MDSFGNRLNAFKAIDEERGQLLQELCERTETLQLQNEGLKSEIAALKTAAAHHHESDELQQCQAMLQETRSQLSSAFQSMVRDLRAVLCQHANHCVSRRRPVRLL